MSGDTSDKGTDMADPTKYNPHFNYSGWEAAGPKRPKPGAELDIDFANIARSVDETIDALKDLRRSDGKLNNGIVDKDALDESARELWESAETAAENAKGSAQSAAGSAASAADSAASAGRSAEAARGYVSDAVSQGNVPIYASVATVEGLNINPNLTAIRTNGYYTPGDGGGALYKRVASEPSHAGKIQSADGAWWELSETVVNATMLGAKGDGVSNNTPFIQAAIEMLSEMGGGTLWFLDGTYLLGPSTVDEDYDNDGVIWNPTVGGGCCLVLRSNVSLRSVNSRKAVLKSAGTGAQSVIWAISPDGNAVTDLEIDGSWNGINGAGHGLVQLQTAGEEYCRDFSVVNNYVHDVASYGIGIQNGDVEGLVIDKNWVFNTGGDGIDVKGRGPSGGEQYSIWITRNHVEKFAQRSSLNNHVGIDWRGAAYVAGNYVFNVEQETPDGNVRGGFRGRSGDDANPFGSKRSKVIGNHAQSNTRASFRGYDVVGNDSIIMGNYAEGCEHGFRITKHQFDSTDPSRKTVIGNIAKDCGIAYITLPDVVGSVFASNSAIECGTMFHLFGDEALITGSYGHELERFVVFNSGVTGNVVEGGKVTNVSGVKISGDTNDNKVRGVSGVVTKGRYISDEFPIDSTGNVLQQIPHDLDVPAGPLDAVLSFRTSQSNQVGYRVLSCDSVTEDMITARVVIDRPSDPGGTARLVVDLDTENRRR